MIDVDEAQRILFSVVKPGPTVQMPLREALFRTLAEPIACDVDYPPFDRSLMDGYAVRAADVANARVSLKLVGQIPAGSEAARALGPSEAMQINTGAPIPPGADAVVRVEDTEPGSTSVTVRVPVPVGNFITRRGTYVRAGQAVLEKGMRLTPAEIGTAASAGAANVTVHKAPRVAILSTGNELIEIDRRPSAAQIRNSNQYQLEALVRSAHVEPIMLGVAVDEREVLREKVVEGLAYEILCITGGVSMGAFDFVPGVLNELGAEFHIEKMAIKPGRPVIFATMPRGTLVFALPGNPVSAFVGFELLVRPAISALEGRSGAAPVLEAATLRGELAATGGRRAFLPGRLSFDGDGRPIVERLSWHGSGDAFGLAGADAMIVRAPSSAAARTGETVMVVRLGC